jgi:hypothetical protein
VRRLIDQHSLPTLAMPVCLKALVSNRIERDVGYRRCFRSHRPTHDLHDIDSWIGRDVMTGDGPVRLGRRLTLTSKRPPGGFTRRAAPSISQTDRPHRRSVSGPSRTAISAFRTKLCETLATCTSKWPCQPEIARCLAAGSEVPVAVSLSCSGFGGCDVHTRTLLFAFMSMFTGSHHSCSRGNCRHRVCASTPTMTKDRSGNGRGFVLHGYDSSQVVRTAERSRSTRSVTSRATATEPSTSSSSTLTMAKVIST